MNKHEIAWLIYKAHQEYYDYVFEGIRAFRFILQSLSDPYSELFIESMIVHPGGIAVINTLAQWEMFGIADAKKVNREEMARMRIMRRCFDTPHTEALYLSKIAVYQPNHGAGRVLLAEVSERAQHLGLNRIQLHVSRSNSGARRFYIANGFKEVSGSQYLLMEKGVG